MNIECQETHYQVQVEFCLVIYNQYFHPLFGQQHPATRIDPDNKITSASRISRHMAILQMKQIYKCIYDKKTRTAIYIQIS